MDINVIIERIKEKEVANKQLTKESLEILAHTSTLQEHNAQLSEQIFEKEEILQTLKLQIASKTQELKLKRASVKCVKQAYIYYKKKEAEQLTERCKFYETQWDIQKDQINAIYQEIAELCSKKDVKKQKTNIFEVTSFEFNEDDYKKNLSQDSISCISIEDCEGEIDATLLSCDTANMNSSVKILGTFQNEDSSSFSQFAREEKSDTLYETGGKGRVTFRSCEYSSSEYLAKRPVQPFPTQQPLGGVIPVKQKMPAKGVVSSERLKPTSRDRSYSQKPMTSWVTSSFGTVSELNQSSTAVRAESSLPRQARQQSTATSANMNPQFVDDPNWEHDFDDFDDFDGEWDFVETTKISSKVDTQNTASQKKANNFQPKKSRMK